MAPSTKTVALFGGSFDPPHVAHQMACLYTLEVTQADCVLMIPCLMHSLGKELAPFWHRAAMCRLACQDLHKVSVSEVEKELGCPSRTLHTIQKIKSLSPSDRLLLVVGEDILEERHKWYGWDQIVSLTELFVIGREGYHGGKTSFQLPRVSSTLIRERLAQGLTVSHLVPRSVLTYIESHGLYGVRTEAPGSTTGGQGDATEPPPKAH